MKTDKSQNIPDFQRDFTEILETVLSSQNFACHFDDNTEDFLTLGYGKIFQTGKGHLEIF